MVERHLGETIDIHGGGVDLVFPHHENEVAQSTCVHSGKTYARFWVHNGLVVVNGEKMSKSLGNFLLVRDLLAELPHRGDAKVLVITGQGRGFCSGGDIEEIIGELQRMEPAQLLEFTRMTGSAWSTNPTCCRSRWRSSSGTTRQ